jgi:hypothetical protein
LYNSNQIVIKTKQQLALNRLWLNTVRGTIIAPRGHIIQTRPFRLWRVLRTCKPFTGAGKMYFIYPLFYQVSLTENLFSFVATTWGIVTGERRGDE